MVRRAQAFLLTAAFASATLLYIFCSPVGHDLDTSRAHALHHATLGTASSQAVRNTGGVKGEAARGGQLHIPSGCPSEVAVFSATSSGDVCSVRLPPLAPAAPEELKQRAARVLEAEGNSFPFTGDAGYNISAAETKTVDRAVRARAKPGEKMPLCAPSTYDGHSVEHLAELFLPGGRGELVMGDELVDLGAGIGKVLAVVALTTNASARGIELSAQRHAMACAVLRRLADVELAPGGQGNAAVNCPPSRRLTVWHGDLLVPPAPLLLPPIGDTRTGALTFFAYAQCFPYGVIAQMMRLVASSVHTCVRLLTTKAPVSLSIHQDGLRRQHGGSGFYALYDRDGDQCRRTSGAPP